MADVKITARNCDSVAKDLQDAATSPSLPLLHQSILKFWINKQFRMSNVLWFNKKQGCRMPMPFLNEKFQNTSPRLEINYDVQKIGGLRSQWNSAQMNNWHPWQLKKSKSWGPFWSYHLGSTANPAHLPKKLAVLFSWYR